MEKEISIIKEELKKLLGERETYIMFAKKFSKRREFIFAIGKSSFLERETIYEDDEYIVMAEKLESELKEKVLEIIK